MYYFVKLLDSLLHICVRFTLDACLLVLLSHLLVAAPTAKLKTSKLAKLKTDKRIWKGKIGEENKDKL